MKKTKRILPALATAGVLVLSLQGRGDECSALFIRAPARGLLSTVLSRRLPIVAAHGKNENRAPEHTWLNLKNSIADGAEILEIDVQLTLDGHFLLAHDPTLHRIVKDYKTAPLKIEAFVREFPELVGQKRSDWDFYLFDRISSLTREEIKSQHMLYDAKRNTFFEFVTLDEILFATDVPKMFRMPRFYFGMNRSSLVQHPEWHMRLESTPIFYLDLKDLNGLSRRLWNLRSWDWQKNAKSYEELEAEARAVITRLADHLERHQAFDRIFIPVRHPFIAKLVREIEPRIAIMMSTEVSPEASASELIDKFNQYLPFKPELAEIKYLGHLKNESLRSMLRTNNIKVFFDQLMETDPSQFQGVYRGDLRRLLYDVIADGPDIIIQSNTPKEVIEFTRGLSKR
jgi:glycerophosphoryl diester phosphodiesterase